ncbi:MAG: serine/threonine protein kinase [Chloroflexi bacterium]|nr:serine/threonine protein kinase [Chloroflexota bacterium]
MAKSNWIGQKIGNRYLIEELLGQGGMSSVYKATDPNLKRVVAVKLIHPHLSSNPDFVQRFEEEASAVAQLRHHGIIQVFDFNKDDDIYYMVLEFVPGETIQAHLKRLNDSGRKLSAEKSTHYMAEICDAVDYAHQRGIIHRDIKPANLMLNTQGQAILMDFGIAKIVGGQRHTATGAVVGTAMYMSPEQIRGEQPDRRTDVYSLGVTFFEMLGGHPPFQADSAMTLMMMHLNDPVPDPRKLNPEVPDGLVAVVNKTLAKNPDDRYQTAAQMATALRNALGGVKSGMSESATLVAGTLIKRSSTSLKNTDATTIEPVNTSPQGNYLGTMIESVPTESTLKPIYTTDIGRTSIDISGVTPNIPNTKSRSKKSNLALPLILGGVFGIGCLILGGIFLVSRLLISGSNPPTEVPIVAAFVNTETPIPLPTATIESVVVAPTEIPTETAIPLTPTPSTPYVVITGIRIENSVYVVDYEVHNYPESSGMHAHMFFNNVTPEQAGMPGSGPWKLTWGAYGNPPFTKYSVASRPSNATQMCALVANSNHSIQLNSGNCVDLP